MYHSCEELRRDIDRYTAELAAKFDGRDGKRYVMLCGGTGCVAGGTPKLKEKFEEYLEEYGLTDSVAIRTVGCFGLCSQGPFVRIFPEDVLYRATLRRSF